MKFYIEGWFHHKNKIGLSLMINNGMSVDFSHKNTKYDCIINTNLFNYYANHEGLVIYGPHILFPQIDNYGKNVLQSNRKAYCNLLSTWNKNLCEEINPGVKCLTLPFPVDVETFKPNTKTGKPVIYFKNVDRSRLHKIITALGKDFIIFDYHHRYEESSFKYAISKAPFCIWIGCHESQGFALQETLSSDTPIFVIDSKSLRDEVIPNAMTPWADYLPGHPLSCTSAPYFNDSCGIISDIDNFNKDFHVFQNNINNYAPREFILENLSPQSCLKLWLDTLSSLL